MRWRWRGSSTSAGPRAEQALREARYDSAIARLQRAVAIDSAFALGYYRLAVAGALQYTPRVTNVAHCQAENA